MMENELKYGDGTQEIVIVRKHTSSNKKPSRYIRVPVSSHDIKIVEFLDKK